jgi:hypothetical protein
MKQARFILASANLALAAGIFVLALLNLIGKGK